MKISVCLASYNGQCYIEAQLLSIVQQLREGDVVLVADDGSTDLTPDLVRKFGAPVQLIATSRIGGVVKNFERVLAAAKGDALVLCDQDDVWLPGRLDLIRKELVHHDMVLLNGQVVDAELQPRGITIFNYIDMRPGVISNFYKNSFIGCCMAFRRELRDRVMPFPKGLPWHDWYIGLAAELTGRVKRIDDITLLYRRHGSNSSPTGEISRNSLAQKAKMRFAMLRALLVVLARGFSIFRRGR
jgi:glycosyltransferase involved in cell wall biosynthesis